MNWPTVEGFNQGFNSFGVKNLLVIEIIFLFEE
jgi:hypothetical protein